MALDGHVLIVVNRDSLFIRKGHVIDDLIRAWVVKPFVYVGISTPDTAAGVTEDQVVTSDAYGGGCAPIAPLRGICGLGSGWRLIEVLRGRRCLCVDFLIEEDAFRAIVVFDMRDGRLLLGH